MSNARDFHKECEGTGLKLINHNDQPAGYGLYEFLHCGHTQLIQYGHVRGYNFACKTCKEVYISSIYKTAGVTFISNSENNNNNKIVKLSCGHVQEVSLQALTKLEFSCKTCRRNCWDNDAEKQGLSVVGIGKDCRYLLYKLPCGHFREIQKGNVKRGVFRCDVCTGTKNAKTFLYLLHIESKGFSWLKLGYSLDVDRRIKQYGLHDGAKVVKLRTWSVSGRSTASHVEALLHNKLTSLGFDEDSNIMEALMWSGFTECYSVDYVNQILRIFDEEINLYGN